MQRQQRSAGTYPQIVLSISGASPLHFQKENVSSHETVHFFFSSLENMFKRNHFIIGFRACKFILTFKKRDPGLIFTSHQTDSVRRTTDYSARDVVSTISARRALGVY